MNNPSYGAHAQYYPPAPTVPLPVSTAPLPVSTSPLPVSSAPLPVSTAPLPVSTAPVPTYVLPPPVIKAPYAGDSGSSSVYPDSFYNVDNSGSLYSGASQAPAGGSLYGSYGAGHGGYGGVNWNAPGSPQGGYLISGHYPNYLFKNIGYGPVYGGGLIRQGY